LREWAVSNRLNRNLEKNNCVPESEGNSDA
jgi:hypothetical protein